MAEKTLWTALAVLNGPFMLAMLYALAMRSGAAWTGWRLSLWLGSLSDNWLTWGPLHMGFLLGLAAWLQSWAIAHRVAAVCLLIWFCNGLILRLTRPPGTF